MRQRRIPNSGWSPNTCVGATADSLSEFSRSQSSLCGAAASTGRDELMTLHDDVTSRSVEIPLRTRHFTASERAELHNGSQEKNGGGPETETRVGDERGRRGWLTEAQQREYIKRSRIPLRRPDFQVRFEGVAYQQITSGFSKRKSI